MAKVPSTTTSTKKTRTPKPVSAAAQSLLNEAIESKRKAQAQISEAKSLGKLIECVSALGSWGLNKLEEAIGARRKAITGEPAAPVATESGQ